MDELLLKEEVYAIVGAAIEVHLLNCLKATGLLINFGSSGRLECWNGRG